MNAVLRFAVLLWMFCPGAFAQVSNHALRFYGTGVGPPGQQDRVRIRIDDNVNGPDASAPCDLGNGSFTVDFWIRGSLAQNATAHGGGDRESFDFNWINGNILVDRDVYGGTDRDWGVSVAGGHIRFGTGRADSGGLDALHTSEGDTPVLNGQWRHIAVVRDASSGIKSIYVDAVLDYATPPGRSRDDISYPNAGAAGQQTPWGWYIVLAAEKHDAGAAYPSFNGYMDEVRFWNRALSAAEIAQHYNRILPAGTAGLAGYYRFEEGAGTGVADSSGAGSPAGELIAGLPGNGEWVSRAAAADNTAPVTGGPPPPAGSLTIRSIPQGVPVSVDGQTFTAPHTMTSADGAVHVITAPQTALIGGTVHQFCCWSDGGARSHSATASAAGRILTAGYKPAAGGTEAATISAASRQADFSPAYGTGFGNPFDAAACCAGREAGGNRYQTGMQFALNIPRGAQITGAVLTVTASADQSGNPAWVLRGFAAGDLAPWVNGSPQPLTAHATLLAEQIPFSPGAWTAGAAVSLPDLTALIHPVIQRSDWAPGNHLGIIVTDATAAGDHWRCWRNPAGGSPPQLTVTWTAPGAGCGLDFDADGLPDAWESANGMDCTDAADAALDPDSDGIDTRLEYALGSDARVPGPGPSMQAEAITVAGESYATLRFTRRAGMATASLIPELSTDLTTWQDGLAPVSLTNANGMDTLTVRDPQPLTQRRRLYFRLRLAVP